jgi:ADP-heptose:LPS heptosyltransferase
LKVCVGRDIVKIFHLIAFQGKSSSTFNVTQPDSFYQQAKDASKLLVLDLGFLGDTIHLLPALWAIRQAWPKAELHVMVAEHVTQILEVAPWVDRVWGYPRFPKGPKPWQDFGRIKQLRDAKFDAVLNLNGSDRSGFLTLFSGAPLRLGRCAAISVKKRVLFTHPIALPRGGKVVSEQHCDFLRQAGIPCGEPEYHISVPSGVKKTVAQMLGVPDEPVRRFVHVSPFTTQDQKELPLDVLASALNMIQSALPEVPMVISCANNDRELCKLAALSELLNFTPHRIFAGTLGLLELVAVLLVSRLHLGGDSGALHVAVMAGAPTVSWFRRYQGANEWAPSGGHHCALHGEESEVGIQCISADGVGAAAVELWRGVSAGWSLEPRVPPDR